MAVDMFMEVDGIGGESTDDAHTGWIELLSVSTGVSQPVSSASATGGRTAGRADFDFIKVRKTVDKATPDLNIHCANGKHIGKITIEFCLATGDKHTFMKYELSDCIIAAVGLSAEATDETKPAEDVHIAYGKIKWEYTEMDSSGSPGGSTDRTWELAKNVQA